MEEAFKPFFDFLLEILKAILENYLMEQNLDLTFVMYIIFVPLTIIFGIVFIKALFERKNKPK